MRPDSLIHLRGYHNTSLDDVLRESGVGKGNFYYYFKSKEELGFAIIDRVVQGFLERTLEPAFADEAADPIAQIHGFLDRVLDTHRRTKLRGRLSAWATSPRSCPTSTRASGSASPRSSSTGGSRWRTPSSAGARGAGCAPISMSSAPPASWWRRWRARFFSPRSPEDIGVMEKSVAELKQYLTLYTIG